MGSAVTELASSGQLDGDSTRSWHSRLGQVGLKSDQALGCASTCRLEACNSCILDKKKMKFGTDTHHLHGLVFTWMFEVLPRMHHLEAVDTLSQL